MDEGTLLDTLKRECQRRKWDVKIGHPERIVTWDDEGKELRPISEDELKQYVRAVIMSDGKFIASGHHSTPMRVTSKEETALALAMLQAMGVSLDPRS